MPLVHHVNNLLLKLCLMLVSTYASITLAIDPTSELPIEIESDTAVLNDQKGVASYSGNVIITQGLSRLEANQISVIAVDKKIVSIDAVGSPAHFVQQDSAEASAIHGYGDNIVYTASNAILKLIKNAILTKDNNSFSGEMIEYDIVKKAIKAKGNETMGTRVKIQYNPRLQEKPATKEIK